MSESVRCLVVAINDDLRPACLACNGTFASNGKCTQCGSADGKLAFSITVCFQNGRGSELHTKLSIDTMLGFLRMSHSDILDLADRDPKMTSLADRWPTDRLCRLCITSMIRLDERKPLKYFIDAIVDA